MILCVTFQISNSHKGLSLAIGIRDCLEKSCNPFLLICVSHLCHKSREVPSSTIFGCPPHTFTCVLYNEQHNLPRATTNDPLVSFQFPLLIKWLYPSLSRICIEIGFKRKSGMCHTSFNINVHPVFVCRCHQSHRSRKHFCFPSSLCHSLILCMLRNTPF